MINEQPIYAIGDVHGRADLLRPLLAEIEADADEELPLIIFLGDIVDRGPDSKEALELVDEALDRFPGSQLLLGNHDEYLLLALEGLLTDTDAVTWLGANGGQATVESYLPGNKPTIEQFAAFIREYYDHHYDLLKGAFDKVIVGQYCFVHAGIRPGVSIEGQNSYDLRWIRDDFLEHRGRFEKVIVHGHTPTDSDLPEVHSNRIAVDTGAYASGRLTACKIGLGQEPSFIAAAVSGEGTIQIERYPVRNVGGLSNERRAHG